MSKPRYVVLVKPPEDHPGAARIVGAFHSREAADKFTEAVRRPINQESLDEFMGYAWTLRLERPRIRAMQRWALKGE